MHPKFSGGAGGMGGSDIVQTLGHFFLMASLSGQDGCSFNGNLGTCNGPDGGSHGW